MYGLVNRAIEDLITREHGADVWAEVAERAGFDDLAFVSMESYPDELTYGLVAAASEILAAPAEEILMEFGRHWIRYTAREGYGELLDASANSFGEFLGRLDQLHARVGLTLPDLQPPSFESKEIETGRHQLIYRSSRDGLAPMVVGLIKGLAERFGCDAAIEHQVKRGEGADHDLFEIQTSPVLAR